LFIRLPHEEEWQSFLPQLHPPCFFTLTNANATAATTTTNTIIVDIFFIPFQNKLIFCIFINVISGPSAFLHALIKSNHNSKFPFLGFIPDKKIKRQNYLSSLTPFTYICYVSPHKLISVLEDFNKIFSSDITLYLIKEMTKIFETS